MARGLPRSSARLASVRDVASRDPRRAAANRAVRQRHPPMEERLMSIDQLSPSGTEVVVQSAEAVAAVVDELRGHQPSWEALGPDGRAAWLRRATELVAGQRVSAHRYRDGRDRQAPRRGRVRSHGHLRRDQLLRRPGPEVPGRKEVAAARSAHRHQEAHQGVPPVPGRRGDHAMELPVTHPRGRRRYGAAGRGGRRRQALGGHSAVRVRTRPRLANRSVHRRYSGVSPVWAQRAQR